MKKTVMNVQTGKAEEVDMTPEEVADIEARRLAMQQRPYDVLRREAYIAAGVTMEAIAEALIEHAGGKSQKLQQLMQLRDAVRSEIPKP